jgi:hypothetical protein
MLFFQTDPLQSDLKSAMFLVAGQILGERGGASKRCWI